MLFVFQELIYQTQFLKQAFLLIYFETQLEILKLFFLDGFCRAGFFYIDGLQGKGFQGWRQFNDFFDIDEPKLTTHDSVFPGFDQQTLGIF